VLMQIYDTKNIARTFTDRAETYRMYGSYLSFRDSTKSQSGLLYKASIDDLKQSLGLGADPYSINLKLARLYENDIKNQKEALRYYEKTLACFPETSKDKFFKDWLSQKIRALKEELHFKGE